MVVVLSIVQGRLKNLLGIRIPYCCNFVYLYVMAVIRVALLHVNFVSISACQFRVNLLRACVIALPLVGIVALFWTGVALRWI